MKLKEIVEILETVAPPECGADWDNSGVQIDVGNDVNRVMFCLDVTDDIIDEAISNKIDLIVSHHPLLFNKPNCIDVHQPQGRYIQKLIRANISVYSAHITFDDAPHGNNVYLANLLNLENVCKTPEKTCWIGNLQEEKSLDEFVRNIENVLKLPSNYLNVVGNNEQKVRKVGLCTGGGDEFAFEAYRRGCDAFITGDVRLHVAQFAKAQNKILINAGHFGTEKIFAENIKKQVENILMDKKMDEIELFITSQDISPYNT